MDNKVNQVTGAISNAASKDPNKTSKDIAQELFGFGSNMDWGPSGNGSFAIRDGMTKEELREQMRQLYNGSDSDFDKKFETFFSVFDQDGNGTFSTSEISLFSDDTKSVTGKSIWHALVNNDMNRLQTGDVVERSNDDAAAPEPAPEASATPSETPKATFSVKPSELPAGYTISGDKIMFNGVQIGEVNIEYKDTNNDGYEDVVPIYCLYGENTYYPKNCFADETGNIRDLQNGTDNGILIKQNYQKGDSVQKADDGSYNIQILGHSYTIANGSDEVKDDAGNVVGKAFFPPSGDGDPTVYLYADADAHNSKNIPSSFTVSRTTGEITNSSGQVVKQTHSKDIVPLMTNGQDGEPNTVTIKDSSGRELPFSVEMPQGEYTLYDKNGNVVGNMIVNEEHCQQIYMVEDYTLE